MTAGETTPDATTSRERARPMSWARLDDGFHDHPKVDGLSLASIGLFTVCLTWAHRHRKTAAIPGLIPVGRVKKLAGNRAGALAKELTTPPPGKEHGLWESSEGGYLIHDFTEYLPKERDPAELAASGRKGGQKRWQNDGSQLADSQAEPKETAKQNEANPIASDSSRASAPAFPTRPDPTRTSNSLSEGGARTSSRDPQDPPPEHCPEHPNGTDEPCGPCAGIRKRREAHDADESARRLQAAYDAKAARDACPRCDETGFVLDPDTGVPLGRCDHQPTGADE